MQKLQQFWPDVHSGKFSSILCTSAPRHCITSSGTEFYKNLVRKFGDFSHPNHFKKKGAI